MASESQAITIPERPYPKIHVELNQYNPVTGESIGAVKSLNFKFSTIAGQTDPVVVKMKVCGVTRISNIRLGIVNANSNDAGASGSANNDGTVNAGDFGIEHSKEFSAKSSLTTFFPGINSTESPASLYNVDVQNASKTGSEFVFLSAKVPSAVNAGFITYKWFFDFI